MPSTSSLPSHTSSGSGIPMAFLKSFQRREHEPSDRGEIVPALLYDDDRQPRLADQPTGLSKSSNRNVERALGIAARSIDAERQYERLGATRSRRLHELAHGPQPLVISRSRW